MAFHSNFDNGKVYEVERIVTHATRTIADVRNTFYLVRWKGYGPEGDTWELESSFMSPKTVRNYLKAYNESELKRKRKAHAQKIKQIKLKLQKQMRLQKIYRAEQAKRHQPPAQNTEHDNASAKNIVSEPLTINAKNLGETMQSNAKSKTGKRLKAKSKAKATKKNQWTVVDILNMRQNYLGTREYLVRWYNKKSTQNSFHAWETEDNLKCKNLLTKFHSCKL